MVECQTCLFVCEVARVTYVTCVFGGSTVFSERGTRDYRKYDMTFFLDQTTLSSFFVSLSVSPLRGILSCRAAPPYSLQPE